MAEIDAEPELDSITLEGLRVRGFHGVYETERTEGQDFVADVTLWLDLAAAATSDSVGDTVHYGDLAEEITAAMGRDPVNLIETLAERIAAVVLSHRAARRVRVTVHKPGAPVTVPFTDVAVTITRSAPADRTPPEHTAVLAFGSNLGPREATILAAVDDLGRVNGIRVDRVSDLIETPALTLDGVDENAPAYLNAIAIVATTLGPHGLLDTLHDVERRHGRVRGERWGDRTLDIDIVAYDGVERADDRLTLPHPRAAERAFVLAPWLQVDPDAVLPGRGRVAELLATAETVRAQPGVTPERWAADR